MEHAFFCRVYALPYDCRIISGCKGVVIECGEGLNKVNTLNEGV